MSKTSNMSGFTRGVTRLFTVAFFAMAAIATVAAQPAAPTKLRVVLDDNYPPYVFKGDDGKIQGIFVDRWELWERATGIDVELVPLPWGEALSRMIAGEFDVIDTAFRTRERERIFAFSMPTVKIEVPLFFDASLSGIKDLGDVGPFVVAAKKGDASLDVLAAGGIRNVELYDGYREIVEAARSGKVKVFIIDEPPARYFLTRMGIESRFRRTSALFFGEFHRAVRKGDERILTVVEKGFASLDRRDLDAVDRKWLGSPVISPVLPGELVRIAMAVAAIVAVLIALLLVFVLLLSRMVASRTADLAASRDFANAVYNSVTDAIFVHAADASIIDCNERAVELYGRSADEIRRIGVVGLSEPDSRFSSDCALANLKAADKAPVRFEWSARDASGRVFPIEVSARAGIIGGHLRYFVTVRDLSELKRNARRLEKALVEKEVLLRELQHRVKNSFALISSLIGLEADSVSTPEAAAAVEALKSRVDSISELYALLNSRESVERVRLDEYLLRITESLRDSLETETVSIESSLEPFEIDVKRAAAVGLVVNELLTNAYKHAFPDGRAGTVRLALRSDGVTVTVSVVDDGVGAPPGLDIAGRKSTGLGLELVSMLAAQLGGTLSFERESGTAVRLDFPGGA